MRIQLTTDRASVLHYFPQGSFIELPDEEAERLVRSGQAIKAESVIETAMVSPALETATNRTARRPRRAAPSNEGI